MRFATLVTVLLVAACGRGVPDGDDDDDAPDAATAPDAFRPDATITDFSLVYAHSGTELFRLDTTTLQPVVIGTFTNTGTQSITDIAIDKDDNMRGITLDRVYTIDESTGDAQLLAELDPGAPNLTSLSYVPVDLADPDGAERLVAAAYDGTVYEIDPADGSTTPLGVYGEAAGGTIRSSGDIVAVRGLGIFATVTIGDDPSLPDHLAVIDPDTWAATPLGTGTAYDKIFGIGFWRDTLYGFVDLGDGVGGTIVTLDPNTGVATPVNTGAIRWYGAGVATDAPVVD